MGKTTMTASDFHKYAAALDNFYAPLYGTPAANIAKDIAYKMTGATHFISDKEPDFANYEELEDGRYQVELSGTEFFTEEILKYHDMDSFVNEKLAALRELVDQGIYPEGTIQRNMVDYMIYGLESLQSRDLIIDPEKNPNGKNMPGFSIADKVANYTFIPKLYTTMVNPVTGEEEMVLPGDFAENDATGTNTFFIPRDDQKNMAKYSLSELQESAERVNFDGFNTAGINYGRDIKEYNDLIGMRPPATPEEEKILSEQILASMTAAEREMRKTMEVDPNDKVALRMFSDNPDYFHDGIHSDGRGFTGNLRVFGQYRRYLEAGLPIAGYGEYHSMLVRAKNLEDEADADRKYAENLDDYHRACRDYREKLENLPSVGSSAEEIKAWQDSVAESAERLCDEEEKIRGKITFPEPQLPAVTSDDPEKRKEEEKARREAEKKYKAACDNIQEKHDPVIGKNAQWINDIRENGIREIQNPGKTFITERRRQVDHLMRDMVTDMDGMGKELTALGKKQRNLPAGLKTAIKNAAAAGSPTMPQSPEAFSRALEAVQTEAKKAGDQEISEWVKKNKAIHDNHMIAAKKKGVLTDEPLNLQRKANARGDREKLQGALELFNTKRAGIFKSETTEHKNLREASEKLINAKNEFAQMRKDPSNPEWRKKAQEIMKLSDTTAKEAMKYMQAKEFSAGTGAGEKRLNGAIMLYRESQMMRVGLKKELAAYERYREMQAKTERMRERNEQLAREDAAAKRSKGLVQDRVKKASAQEKFGVDTGREKEPAVKDLSFDSLADKLGANRPAKEFQGRKSVPANDAPAKKGPVKNGP